MTFLRSNPWLVVLVAPGLSLWFRWIEKHGKGRVAGGFRRSSQMAYDMELERRRAAVEELRQYGRGQGYDV